jgi:phospholipid N-methyltransferase
MNNAMDDDAAKPFDSLENAHEYLSLLLEALEDARHAIDEDLSEAAAAHATRRVEALQVIVHQLSLLDQHVRRSSRIINDLRTLRRMLLGERQTAVAGLSD